MCGFTRAAGAEEFRASSLETLRHMVAAGVGCTLLPILAATSPSPSEAGIAIRPFAAPLPSRTIGLAYRRGFPRTEMLQALITLIRKQMPAQVIPIAADAWRHEETDIFTK